MTFNMKSLKDHFPALRKSLYFNTGSEGLIPRSSYNAMNRHLTRLFKYGGSHPDYFSFINGYFDKLKEIMKETGVEYKDCIKVSSISEGLNFSFNMYPLKVSDKILLLKEEFSTVILAALVCMKRVGCEIIWADNIENAIDIMSNEKIEIFALSHVSYRNGKIYDISQIYKECKKNDVFFIVDGAQAFGNIFWDFSGISGSYDMYVWTTHKWALSPRGLGFVIPSEKAVKKCNPVSLHYFSVKEFNPPDKIEFTGDVSDLSNHVNNFTGEIGFVESYRFLRKKYGFDNIFIKNKEIRDYFLEKASENGIKISNSDSNLLAFKSEKLSNVEVVDKFYRHGIILRTIPNTEDVRVSIHLYIDRKSVDKFFRIWRKIHK